VIDCFHCPLQEGNATWVDTGLLMQIELPRSTFTRVITLTFKHHLRCSRFEVLGCETDGEI